MAERIYVDFNSRVAEDKVIIPSATAAEGRIHYRVGDHVILYDEELEVQARLEYSPKEDWWLGVTDWRTKQFHERMP